MERNAAFAVELGARHFCAAETTGDLNTNALGAGALCSLKSLAHRAAERHTSGKLFSDSLSDELCVGFGVECFNDVDDDDLAGEDACVIAELVETRSLAADGHAGASNVDVDRHAIAGTANDHVRNSRTVKLLLKETAKKNVFRDIVRVALASLGAVGEPLRTVVGRDSEAESVGVYFLTHYFLPAFEVGASGVLSTTVMWLVRLRIWNARP